MTDSPTATAQRDAIGKLCPSSSMFLTVHCGTATAADGTVYELGTCITTGSPIIRNKTTGRSFLVGWTELLELAKRAGIDTPEAK